MMILKHNAPFGDGEGLTQCNWAVGTVVGLSALAVGAGSAIYEGVSAPSEPSYTSPTTGTTATSNDLLAANAQQLSEWLQEEAAAQTGGKTGTAGTPSTPAIPATPGYWVNAEGQQSATQPMTGGGEELVRRVSGGGYEQQYVAPTPTPGWTYVPGTAAKAATTGTAAPKENFAGYSTADIEAAQAEQAAQSQIALAQQYDPQFIAQALAEEQQANPQGAAARTEENQLIQQEVAKPQVNPVANQLNTQVAQQISAAANNTMTPAEEAQFSKNVSESLAQRGSGAASPAAFETPIVTGASGTQRQQAAASEGTGWLSSGQTPADFAYRQQQQGMADLSAMINGTTPESQFKQLSGAGSGPTPESTATTSQLPNQPNAGQQASIQATNTEMSSALNQANPWTVGLSATMNLGTALASSPAL